MRAEVFWNIRDWADAVAQMPMQGPLPSRTVLVPRERVAHVFRRELIRSKRPNALAGTRFVQTTFATVDVFALRSRHVLQQPPARTLFVRGSDTC
jgi:hypothetical protein